MLEKQGQDFLSQFSTFRPQEHITKLDSGNSEHSSVANDLEEEEEWLGFSDAFSNCDAIPKDSKDYKEDHEIVIFNDTLSKKPSIQRKEPFMSSKVSKLKESRHEANFEDDGTEEESNARNDALLHRLIHTELFSGSLKNEAIIASSAQQRKALTGRVLELRGDAKLGKGEVLVRREERNHASKSVREGLLSKENQRRERALAEAKEAGNYHSSLRKLYHIEKTDNRRKRERGLSMGVGRYKGGVLRLSAREIRSVEGTDSPSSIKKRSFKKKN